MTQDLSSFTVQMTYPDRDEIVGTGFVISPDGLIATCLHVVQAARQTGANGLEWVGVYFPKTRHRLNAQVLPERQMPHDDLAVVRLAAPLPEGAGIALLGSSDGCQDHRWRSYGFRPLPPYEGGPASGVILGKATRDADSLQYYDPLLLRSPEISPGMSGSPVLDLQTDRVVGVITATWQSSTAKDRDSAFAAPAEALVQLVPNLSLHPPEAVKPRREDQRVRRIVMLASLILAVLLGILAWKLAPWLPCSKQLPDVSSYIARAKEFRDLEGHLNLPCARHDYEAGLWLAVSANERAELYYGLATVDLLEWRFEDAHEHSLLGLKQDSQGEPLLYLSDGLALCFLHKRPEAAGQVQLYLNKGGAPFLGAKKIADLQANLAAGIDVSSDCESVTLSLP